MASSARESDPAAPPPTPPPTPQVQSHSGPPDDAHHRDQELAARIRAAARQLNEALREAGQRGLRTVRLDELRALPGILDARHAYPLVDVRVTRPL